MKIMQQCVFGGLPDEVGGILKQLSMSIVLPTSAAVLVALVQQQQRSYALNHAA